MELDRDQLRFLKIFLVGMCVIIILVGSIVATQNIMRHRHKLKVETTETSENHNKEEPEEELVTKGFKDDSIIEIEGKSFAKTERMFDSNDIQERQEKFLGENYESLKPALDSIESDYSKIFYEIGSVEGTQYDMSSCIDMSKSPINVFSEEFLNSGMTAYNPVGGTIVGMYGTHCIVYQMYYDTDFAQPLIAIDYSDMHIDTTQEDVFGFGQCKSFYIDSRFAKLVDYGGYSVLYVRGY